MVRGSNNDGSSNNDDVIGDYRPGSIRRVKLQNFLTHGNVEFKPGPRYVLRLWVVPDKVTFLHPISAINTHPLIYFYSFFFFVNFVN